MTGPGRRGFPGRFANAQAQFPFRMATRTM